MEVVASLSQGRTAAARCGLFTHKSVPVIFEPPCICGTRLGIIKDWVIINYEYCCLNRSAYRYVTHSMLVVD